MTANMIERSGRPELASRPTGARGLTDHQPPAPLDTLRKVEPEHRLTIMSAGDGYKAGRCSCTWNAVASKDQDDIGRQFAAHRDAAPGPVVSTCDCCQVAPAAVRHGCVDLCGRCALDELVRNGELEVVA